MKPEELRLFDWVLEYANINYWTPAKIRIIQNKEYQYYKPIPITESTLANNGWILKSGIWVYKGSVRLGWKDGKLYIGYAEWPKPIRFAHELQNVMYDAGLEEESINFKL